MGPANVLDFEAIAKTKLSPWGYEYIATGVEEEVTLRANRAAFDRVWLRRRAMVDVTKIDTSLEILGTKLDFPILLDPTGGKDIDDHDADQNAAEGAFPAKAIYCVAAGPWMAKLHAENRAPVWWSNSVGLGTQQIATNFARRSEDMGCSAIILTMDYEYTPNRDRYIRMHYDWGYHQPGPPQNGVKLEPRRPTADGMLVPATPSMTWDTVNWLRSAAKVPVCIKGILRPDDAEMAIKSGAQAIVVSNHGGRALDGGIATLDALPAVVKQVNGRIPVLMDSGVRRGDDILKALALGAKAVLVGRPYVWGLAAFGKEGLQRVVDILRAELVLAMGLAGVSRLADIDSSLVCRAWEPPASAAG
jgi:isopentenyl diphosphate isomerase/L-lactate dehydrogenase-like FMN-dependent dehydrogenase